MDPDPDVAPSRFTRLDKLRMASVYWAHGECDASKDEHHTSDDGSFGVRSQSTAPAADGAGKSCDAEPTAPGSAPQWRNGHVSRDAANALVYGSRDDSASGWGSYEVSSEMREFTGKGAAYAALYHSPLDQKLYAARAGSSSIDVYGAPAGGTRVNQSFTNYPISVTINGSPLTVPFLDLVTKPASGGSNHDGTAYILADTRGGTRVVAVQLAKAGRDPDPAAAPPTFDTPGCRWLALVDGKDSYGQTVPGKYVYAFGDGLRRESSSMYRINTAVANGDVKEVKFTSAGKWYSWGRPAFTSNGKWVRYGASGDYGFFYGQVEKPGDQAGFRSLDAFEDGNQLWGEMKGQPWPVADGGTVYCVSYFNICELYTKYAPHSKEHKVRKATKIDLSGSTPSITTDSSDWVPPFPGGRVGWRVDVRLFAMTAWWT